eukprot:7357800-Ditylum_brightwellii.AAC.1
MFVASKIDFAGLSAPSLSHEDPTRSPAATSAKAVALPRKSTLLDRPLSSTQSTSTHVLCQTPA